MMGWISGMDAGAWIWMLVWIFALVLMIWLIVRGDHRASADDPDSILRARFARGEIDAEEFKRAELVLHERTGSTR